MGIQPTPDKVFFPDTEYLTPTYQKRSITEIMKWLITLISALGLAACAGLANEARDTAPETTTAQVGIVNHTGNYIYSASVNGAGGGNMKAWRAGVANICCTSIPHVWHSGIRVRVRWDMPDGHTHNIKEKITEVEKYDRPGDIYLHFFPNDEVRVIVTNIGGPSSEHPIPPPAKPAGAD